MTSSLPVELHDRPAEVNPHQVLYLLPSAPLDLIVEVYWHLVHQLQVAAGENPHLRIKLDGLNEAYAMLASPHINKRSEGPASVENGKPTGLSRFWKRQTTDSRPTSRHPWQILHLDPTAPRDVVDLAYHFWRLRLRSRWDGSTAEVLEQLEEARDLLQNRDPDQQIDSNTDESAIDGDTEEAPWEETGSDLIPGVEPEAPAPGQEEAAGSRRPSRWSSIGSKIDSLIRWDPLGRWKLIMTTTEQLELGADAPEVADQGLDGPPGEQESRTDDQVAEAYPVPESKSESEEADTSHVAIEERLAALADSHEAAIDIQIDTSDIVRDEAAEAPGTEVDAQGGAADTSVESQRSVPRASELRAKSDPLQAGQAAKPSARLVSESGSIPGLSATIGSIPISIGTDPFCDIAVPAANSTGKHILARIWLQDERFMFHGLAAGPTVLVNGQGLEWAVLEDGDTLQVGDAVLHFQRISSDAQGS